MRFFDYFIIVWLIVLSFLMVLAHTEKTTQLNYDGEQILWNE